MTFRALAMAATPTVVVTLACQVGPAPDRDIVYTSGPEGQAE